MSYGTLFIVNGITWMCIQNLTESRVLATRYPLQADQTVSLVDITDAVTLEG